MDQGSCRVLLIDIGHETWLLPSLLHPLLPSHCNLPQLAQAFHLKSVSPVGRTKLLILLKSDLLHSSRRGEEVDEILY